MQDTIKTAVFADELDQMFDIAAVDRVTRYAHNIVRAFESADERQLAGGLYWYDEARGEAARVARECGISLETAALVLAVTSPSVSWHNQCTYTIPFVQAVLAGADAESFKAPFYPANRVKAARILAGDKTALSGVKVEAFYRNIMGQQDVATIDRHALRVALDEDLTPEQCKVWLSPKSRARLEIVAAYHLAAAQLGYTVAQVQAVTWVVWRGKAD